MAGCVDAQRQHDRYRGDRNDHTAGAGEAMLPTSEARNTDRRLEVDPRRRHVGLAERSKDIRRIVLIYIHG